MANKTTNLRERRKVSITFDESLTEQNHRDKTNISNILNKYKKTGMLTHVNHMQGTYADYPNANDFHEIQNVIANAKSMFESIPSHIRAEFNNDPGQFIDFANNPENREELIELGFSDEHLPPAEEPETAPAKKSEPEQKGGSAEGKSTEETPGEES